MHRWSHDVLMVHGITICLVDVDSVTYVRRSSNLLDANLHAGQQVLNALVGLQGLLQLCVVRFRLFQEGDSSMTGRGFQ